MGTMHWQAESLHCSFLLLLVTALVSGQEGSNIIWRNNLQQVLQDGVMENNDIGYELGMLQATSSTGENVTYASDSDLVTVDSSSGVVTLNQALDREREAQHEITFYAISGTFQSEVTVTLRVLDDNDNTPVFSQPTIQSMVSMVAGVGTVVYEGDILYDTDEGDNARLAITCSALEGDSNAEETCGTFSLLLLGRGAGLYTVLVVLNRALDAGVRSSYAMNLVARDFGDPALESTTLTFTVTVDGSDVGDQPEFLSLPLTTSIYENTLAGTVVRDIQVFSFSAVNIKKKKVPTATLR